MKHVATKVYIKTANFHFKQMTNNTLALFDSKEKMELFGPLDATCLKPVIQDPFLKTVCWLQVNNSLLVPSPRMIKNNNKSCNCSRQSCNVAAALKLSNSAQGFNNIATLPIK